MPNISTVPLSVGIDMIEISRIAAAVERWGERFLTRVYTADEIARCHGKVASLAARFAAKEATSKALGVGIGWGGGLRWTEIEVHNDRWGKPKVMLHGQAAELATKLGLNQWAISLSHSKDYAIAMVVALHSDEK